MSALQHAREAERLLGAYTDAWHDVEAMPHSAGQEVERRLFATEGARLLLVKAGVHAALASAPGEAHADFDPAEYLPQLGDVVRDGLGNIWFLNAAQVLNPWTGVSVDVVGDMATREHNEMVHPLTLLVRDGQVVGS